MTVTSTSHQHHSNQQPFDEERHSGTGAPTDDRQVEDPNLVATHDPTTQRHVQGISNQQEADQLTDSIVYPSDQANRTRNDPPQEYPPLEVVDDADDPEFGERLALAMMKHRASPSPFVATQESRAPPPPLPTKKLDETAEDDDGTDDRFSDEQQRDDQSGCKYSSGTNDGLTPTPGATQDDQSITNGEGSAFAQHEDGELTGPEEYGGQQANHQDDDDDDAHPQ